MKPETHVDLEEMRSDVTNCHHHDASDPHPIGFQVGREQQKSSREAEVDLDQRFRVSVLEGEQQWCKIADPQATPERLLPPPTISDPLI